MSSEKPSFEQPKSSAQEAEERVEQGLAPEFPEPAQKQEDEASAHFEEQVTQRKQEDEAKIQEIRSSLGLENPGELSKEDYEKQADEIAEAALKNAENVLAEIGNSNLSVKRDEGRLIFSYDSEGYYGPPLFRRGPAEHFQFEVGAPIRLHGDLGANASEQMKAMSEYASSGEWGSKLKSDLNTWLKDLEDSGKIHKKM